MDENTKYAMDIIDADHQRQITRLWIALAITGLLFVATNIFWIYREFQYEDVVTTVTQDMNAESGNAIIYDNYAGATINGENKADDNNTGTP